MKVCVQMSREESGERGGEGGVRGEWNAKAGAHQSFLSCPKMGWEAKESSPPLLGPARTGLGSNLVDK